MKTEITKELTSKMENKAKDLKEEITSLLKNMKSEITADYTMKMEQIERKLMTQMEDIKTAIAELKTEMEKMSRRLAELQPIIMTTITEQPSKSNVICQCINCKVTTEASRVCC